MQDAYISRSLTYIDKSGQVNTLKDTDRLPLNQPIIILGEPGMGKSRLLEKFAEQSGSEVVKAKAFLRRNIRNASASRGLLIIDALDEVTTAKDSDGLNSVLKHLNQAGKPNFILSCRSSEWRDVVDMHDIAEDYGVSPLVLALNPLSKGDARDYLEANLKAMPLTASGVLENLTEAGASDLFGNPLLLQLISQVVSKNRVIPKTRADLFTRSCGLFWKEHDPNRPDTQLNNLNDTIALDAAGAICAVWILTDVEAISKRPAISIDPTECQVSEIARLPLAAAAETVLGSKLFQLAKPNQIGRFAPIHRAIAEFLGARWISKTFNRPQASRRVFEMLTLHRSVPSSFRGLHAWLPHFSPSLAKQAILNDPYGVLRYGDSEHISVANGKLLLEALLDVAETQDPYFRANDWGRHASAGLARPELQPEILKILCEPNANFHLSTLLVEALSSTVLTDDTRAGLLILLLDDSRRLDLRRRFCEVLIAADQNRNWTGVIEALLLTGTHDGYRLVLELLAAIKFREIPNVIIVETIALCFVGRRGKSGVSISVHARRLELPYGFYEALPLQRIAAILDGLSARVAESKGAEESGISVEIKALGLNLIYRAIRHESIGASRLWAWLKIFGGREGYASESTYKSLSQYFQLNLELKREIQSSVVFSSEDEDTVWKNSWALQDVLPALSLDAQDAEFFLENLPKAAGVDLTAWRFLVTRLRGQAGFPKRLWKIARKFAAKDELLVKFLQENMMPNVAPWQVEQDAKNKARAELQIKRWKSDRRKFNENIDSLKAGVLSWTLEPARVYLGCYLEFDNEKLPCERLTQWLGLDLGNAALEGFEATLSQKDLPTGIEVAEGYAKNLRWNIAFPIIVALAERTRMAKGFSDLPMAVLLLSSIVLIQDEHLLRGISSNTTATDVLDSLWETGFDKKDFYRILIEPQFLAKKDHMLGLYDLTRNVKYGNFAAELCAEWLEKFTDSSDRDEFELIDCVCKHCGPSVLENAFLERSRSGFRNQEQRLRWIGVRFLSIEKINQFESISFDRSATFLWTLRYLFREDLKRETRLIGAEKLAWIVKEFRAIWPYAEHPLGVTSGDTNSWDATEFLLDVIGDLSSKFEECSTEHLLNLRMKDDGYSKHILHAISQHKRAMLEKSFAGVTFDQLQAVSERSSPGSIGDLQAYVLDALEDIQTRLKGSDTDPSKKYYDKEGLPIDEPTSSQRIVEELRAIGSLDGIQFDLERLMPWRKNVDIGCSFGSMNLPIEVKGQWNKDLWTAATEQLDKLYAIDSKANGRGIYLALWFGKLTLRSKKLKARPKALGRSPESAAELELMLAETIPYARRGDIVVKVLDFTR